MKNPQFKTVCAVHGTFDKAKNHGGSKWVGVGAPRGRKQRQQGGCPQCAKLARVPAK